MRLTVNTRSKLRNGNIYGTCDLQIGRHGVDREEKYAHNHNSCIQTHWLPTSPSGYTAFITSGTFKNEALVPKYAGQSKAKHKIIYRKLLLHAP